MDVLKYICTLKCCGAQGASSGRLPSIGRHLLLLRAQFVSPENAQASPMAGLQMEDVWSTIARK